jgi:sorbitol-specific phosphotransferase system component IIC
MFLLLIVLSIKQPHYALVVAWCMNGLDQFSMISSPFLSRQSYLANLAIALIIGIAFVRSFFHRELVPWRSKGISIWLWLMMSYTWLSLMWSPVQQKAIGFWLDEGLPYFFILMVLLPYIMTNLHNTHNSLRLVIILSVILVAIFVFGAKWDLRGLAIEAHRLHTGQKVKYTNPLALAELGSYLVVVSGLLWTGRSISWRILRGAGIILGLLIAAKSGCRGQFFASLIAIILCMPINISLRKIITPKTVVGLPILFITLIVIGSFVITSESKSNQGRFEEDAMKDSYMERIDMASKLLKRTWEEPLPTIFGLGNSASFHHEIIGFYPHIVAAEILGEEGLVGFVLFMGLVVSSGVVIMRLVAMNLPPEGRSLIAIFSGILFLQFFLSCKQGSLLGAPFFWSAFLMLERLYNIALRDQGKVQQVG